MQCISTTSNGRLYADFITFEVVRLLLFAPYDATKTRKCIHFNKKATKVVFLDFKFYNRCFRASCITKVICHLSLCLNKRFWYFDFDLCDGSVNHVAKCVTLFKYWVKCYLSCFGLHHRLGDDDRTNSRRRLGSLFQESGPPPIQCTFPLAQSSRLWWS